MSYVEFWGEAYDADPSYLRELERACAYDPLRALVLVAEYSGHWWSKGLRRVAAEAAERVLTEFGQHVPAGLEEEYLLAVLQAAPTIDPESLAVAREIAVRWEAPFRYPLTVLLWATTFGPFEEPATVARILARNERDGDAWTRAAVQVCIGYPGLTGVGPAESEQAARTALARFRMLGDRRGMLLALTAVTAHTGSGDELDEAVAIAADLGLDEELADLLCRRAELLGRPVDYQVALNISERLRSDDLVAVARLGLARTARAAGDLSTARRHIAAVLDLFPADTDAHFEALHALKALDAVQ